MLEAFGQQDPLVQYRRKGHDLYDQFRVIFRKNVVHQIYHVLYQPTAPLILQDSRIAGDVPETETGGDGHKPNGRKPDATARQAAAHSKRKGKEKITAGRKIGRNDPCFCGSGKKYKFCHGRT
jgi:preprotein translocase subunit SecA